MDKPYFSIITPTYNSEKTLKKCLQSIKSQLFTNYELLIVDNLSKDRTLKIVKEFKFNKVKIISKKDKGIYDAINIGISNSSGKVISILHSDDFYSSKYSLKYISDEFKRNNKFIVYGNIKYVKRNNSNKILRTWISGEFKNGLFLLGWSPPHTAFFIKKKIHEKFGLYKNQIGNSADIELMYRMLEKHKISNEYLNKTLVKMRYGGKSNNNLIVIFKQNLEIIKFLNLKNPFQISIFICSKIINRISQFFKKK